MSRIHSLWSPKVHNFQILGGSFFNLIKKQVLS